MDLTFRVSFEQFMHSLASKDRISFQEFLDQTTFVFAILPPARAFDSLEAYEASQEHWFGGTTGSFKYTIEKAEEEEGFGIGIVRAIYSNTDADSNSFTLNLWISFVFKRVDQNWKMAFVQNTRID